MLSDSQGQSVQYPTLEDKPNARTLAEGIVGGIVPQTVMRFDSAAQRNATLSSPKAGMQAYLRDLQVWTGYDGAQWVTLAAGTSVWTAIGMPSGWTSPIASADNNLQGQFMYRVVNMFGEKTLMLKGGIHRSSAYPSSLPSYFSVSNTPLPAYARPAGRRTVLVACSDVQSDRINLKLDINTDGTLYLYGIQTKSKPPWVSFNGVFTSL